MILDCTSFYPVFIPILRSMSLTPRELHAWLSLRSLSKTGASREWIAIGLIRVKWLENIGDRLGFLHGKNNELPFSRTKEQWLPESNKWLSLWMGQFCTPDITFSQNHSIDFPLDFYPPSLCSYPSYLFITFMFASIPSLKIHPLVLFPIQWPPSNILSCPNITPSPSPCFLLGT